MKKLVVIAAAFAMMVATPATASAQQDARPDGVGVGLGQGTGVSGISGKVHTGDTALQGVLGSWRRRPGALGISGDFLFNMDPLTDPDVVQLAWNIGFGGSVGFSPRPYRHTFEAHIQGVLGLEFIFPDIPLDLVLELRPAVRLVPLRDAFVWAGGEVPWGGIHIRYYFE